MSPHFSFMLLLPLSAYVLRQLGLVREEAARDLNHLVFYLALPALIALSLHRAALSWDMWRLPAIAWGLAGAGLFLGVGLARWLRLGRPAAGALAVGMAFGNTTYVGYPTITAFWGAAQLPAAILYDQLGASLATNSLGTAFAARMGGERLGWGALFRRMVLLPPLWAMGLGLLSRGWDWPLQLVGLLERLGGLTTPLVLLAIGLGLRLSDWREGWPLVLAIALVKLGLLPMLAFGLGTWLELPLAQLRVVVVQAAMPTMFYSLVLAGLFGLDKGLMSRAVVLTTLLGLLSLPMWRLWL